MTRRATSRRSRAKPASRSRMPILAVLALLLAAATLGPIATRAEEFQFQSDVQRVMQIIINSLYKTKEIFLRELVSNAADAIEKSRFLGITDKNVLAGNPHFNITIEADKDARTLTIADSGIGMTKEDLQKNLGTIAKSGTADFLRALETSNDKNAVGLIGQFGCGFYASYLVADKVTVISKHPNDDQHIWESNAANAFTIVPDPAGNTLGRGTKIVLHLKDDATEYLEDVTLRSLVTKYSEFVPFPIYLHTRKTIEVDVPVEGEDKDTGTDAAKKPESDDEYVVIENEDKEETTKTRKVKKEVDDWEQLNTQKPLWLRSPSGVSDDDYNAFFKAFFREQEDPSAHIHFKGEGGSDFKALLYIPNKPAQSVTHMNPESGLRNIKLFVRRVFITDELIDFLPRWLSFIKGIIDSDDFPLNVSRETVQETKLLKQIKNKIVSKALQLIRQISRDDAKYKAFYDRFGGYLKLGVLDDSRHQTKLAKLLRYATTASTTDLTSLDDYVARMRKGQKAIYYLTGSDVAQLRKSPYLETLVQRGYEVLLMDDGLDEYVTQTMPSFDGVALKNVGKGTLEFGDEDDAAKAQEKDLADKYQPLTTWLTTLLKDHVDKTVISNRLTTSPCALVAPEMGWTGRMQSMMMLQKDAMTGPNAVMYEYLAKQKKVLEINPKHPVMAALLAKVEDDDVNADVEDLARSLLDMAWIKGGYPVQDLDSLTRRIENAVRLGLGVDLTVQPEVDVKKAPEVDADRAKKTTSDDEVDEESEEGDAEKAPIKAETEEEEKKKSTDAPAAEKFTSPKKDDTAPSADAQDAEPEMKGSVEEDEDVAAGARDEL
ncbi:hypothetical protein AMAG_00364 [Allomyces macrogynus ATCC 38327]|uniref:Hsp90-like protein n=1 Tax=Allomyces macrogynus (strain ATCC 38327) TaxID=578462 RepID=A0A0L0RW71_ALLM3|nr:hypothetical protein AMAG_00364 [Allomyces macrogynus ATCC 38327]|eukprot:KNE54389.1 hypothetical protein AMAG_00364 [Allomyces macrogynus ATCC 38327]